MCPEKSGHGILLTASWPSKRRRAKNGLLICPPSWVIVGEKDGIGLSMR